MQNNDEVLIPSSYEELDGSNEVVALKGIEEQKSLIDQIGDDLLTKEEFEALNEKNDKTVAVTKDLDASDTSTTNIESLENALTNSEQTTTETIVSVIAEPEHVETKTESTDLVEIPQWDLEPPFDAIDRSEV